MPPRVLPAYREHHLATTSAPPPPRRGRQLLASYDLEVQGWPLTMSHGVVCGHGVPLGDGDMTFESIFATGDLAHDNFRSRLFGMFSEDVMRFWARGDAPYRALDGRPTIYEGTAHATIDFTLERRSDGRLFIAEQKAELAWTGYAYLRLDNAGQVDHHRGRTPFDWFLEAAREPAKRLVKTAGKVTPIDGAILVWGAVSEQGRRDAIAELGLADVLSLEDMIAELRARQDPDWSAHVERLERFAAGLFKALR